MSEHHPKRSWLEPPETEAVLAVGSITLFAAVIIVLMFWPLPDMNREYLMLMLGALIGIVKDTFGRYFQATKGAQEQRREGVALAQTTATAAAHLAAATAAERGALNTADQDT